MTREEKKSLEMMISDAINTFYEAQQSPASSGPLYQPQAMHPYSQMIPQMTSPSYPLYPQPQPMHHPYSQMMSQSPCPPNPILPPSLNAPENMLVFPGVYDAQNIENSDITCGYITREQEERNQQVIKQLKDFFDWTKTLDRGTLSAYYRNLSHGKMFIKRVVDGEEREDIIDVNTVNMPYSDRVVFGINSSGFLMSTFLNAPIVYANFQYGSISIPLYMYDETSLINFASITASIQNYLMEKKSEFNKGVHTVEDEIDDEDEDDSNCLTRMYPPLDIDSDSTNSDE